MVDVIGKGKDRMFLIEDKGIFNGILKFLVKPTIILKGDCIEIYKELNERTMSEIAESLDRSSSFVYDKVREMVEVGIVSEEKSGGGMVRKKHNYSRKIPTSNLLDPYSYFIMDLAYINLFFLLADGIVAFLVFKGFFDVVVFPILLLSTHILLIIYLFSLKKTHYSP